MKVLCSCLMYHPAVGGTETVIKNVFERLAGRGAEFEVVSTTALRSDDIWSRKAGSETRERINGVDVVRCPVTDVPGKPMLASALDRVSVYGHGGYSWGQFKHLLRDECDIVHSTPFPSTHNYYSFLAARARRKPFVVSPHLHLEDPYHAHRESLFYMMRHSAAVIALTDYEKRFYVNQGVDAAKIHVTGVGIDPNEYRTAGTGLKESLKASHLVAFIGRKQPYKGFDVAVDAVRLLSREFPALRLVCAGPETDYSRQFWKTVPEGVRKNIVVMDEVSDGQKNAILSEADVFVMPSTAESFGIVYLEAWMHGKPVIGADSGAVASVIGDGVDGFLVAPGDFEGLASRIRELLRDREMAARMGAAGREKALGTYTWDLVAERWLEVFRGVL
jgi:glycosyltransferase involved in cell wall biosynthesis